LNFIKNSILSFDCLNLIYQIYIYQLADIAKKIAETCICVTFKLPLKMKVREVIAYENYFEDFLLEQPKKVQDKIFKIIEAIETLERVPSNYLKSMEGTNGLYEARIQLASNIWRVFCFFDNGKLVILLNGFQKKTQKTPKNEIEKALRLMKEYYEEKNK
jgi:phage-related protein